MTKMAATTVNLHNDRREALSKPNHSSVGTVKLHLSQSGDIAPDCAGIY